MRLPYSLDALTRSFMIMVCWTRSGGGADTGSGSSWTGIANSNANCRSATKLRCARSPCPATRTRSASTGKRAGPTPLVPLSQSLADPNLLREAASGWRSNGLTWPDPGRPVVRDSWDPLIA